MIGQVGGKWHLGAKVFTFRSETFADIWGRENTSSLMQHRRNTILNKRPN
jgi:hypothetical protein